MQQTTSPSTVKKNASDYGTGVNKANMDTFSRKEILQMLNSGVLLNANMVREKSSVTTNEKSMFTIQLPHCNLSEVDLRHLNLERANFYVKKKLSLMYKIGVMFGKCQI